jgi:hypothetical protein
MAGALLLNQFRTVSQFYVNRFKAMTSCPAATNNFFCRVLLMQPGFS